MNYMTILGAKWKASETFEWIFGAVYTTGLGDDLFVPAVGFSWEPQKNQNCYSPGQSSDINTKISEPLSFILAGQFTGNRWNTQSTSYTGSKQERNFRLRSYRISAGIQWNLTENHGVFLNGGIDLARKVEN